MPNSKVLPIRLRAVVPTSGGTAIFLGNEEKVFLIYVDNAVGAAIAMHLGKVKVRRPQTHDLLETLLVAFGARVERVVINDFRDNTYYARIILSVENELQERKLVEIDARPSDSIALALRSNAPLFVAPAVWEEATDMSHLLESMEAEGSEVTEPAEGAEDTGDEEEEGEDYGDDDDDDFEDYEDFDDEDDDDDDDDEKNWPGESSRR